MTEDVALNLATATEKEFKQLLQDHEDDPKLLIALSYALFRMNQTSQQFGGVLYRFLIEKDVKLFTHVLKETEKMAKEAKNETPTPTNTTTH